MVNISSNIKIDINIAITLSVTILLLFNNHAQQQQTEEVKHNVDIKVNKTIEKINVLGNSTELSKKQILQIVTKILKEVQ